MAIQTYIRPFHPQTATQTQVVTASNSTVTLPTAIGYRSVRLVVSGSSTVFWSYGATAAVATSTPMLPGTVETFFLPNDVTQISFIASATGSTVYVTVGESA